ncbi:hypothetical protein [Bacillus litorisediminis]|uniref:hypothetical protein n=1 Tax=Bacillus litorisediminis TaxID=2922713 RepID=UPI001FAE360E|nr:hypothetical protein [Bacillus litorisediminis]
MIGWRRWFGREEEFQAYGCSFRTYDPLFLPKLLFMTPNRTYDSLFAENYGKIVYIYAINGTYVRLDQDFPYFVTDSETYGCNNHAIIYPYGEPYYINEACESKKIKNRMAAVFIQFLRMPLPFHPEYR